MKLLSNIEDIKWERELLEVSLSVSIKIFNYTVNALQGVLIFVALVCKKSILGRLYRSSKPSLAAELRNHAVKMADIATSARQSSDTVSTSVDSF